MVAQKPPLSPIIIWDEKKIERNGSVKTRMPVTICGYERKPQHIGSFLLENGRGATIAKEVVMQASKWGVGLGKDGVHGPTTSPKEGVSKQQKCNKM